MVSEIKQKSKTKSSKSVTAAPVSEQPTVHQAVVIANPPQLPVAFDVTKDAIAQMKAHADSLSIAGPDDKAGFKQVYEYRQLTRRQRLAVEKRAKELKDPHTAYNKQVDAIMEELTEPLKGIEAQLKQQETDYEIEKERLAKEKALAQQQRMESRVNQLRAYGYQWNAKLECYELPNGPYFVNFDDIKNLSDEEYAPTADNTRQWFEQEQARLAKEDEERRILAEQLAAEQKAEADRLAEQARLLQEQQAEIRRQQEELLAAQKRIKDEKDALTLKERTLKLVELGFTVTPKWVLHENYAHYPETVILNMTEEEFAETIADFKQWQIMESTRKEQERIQAEKDEALLAERIERLLAAGFVEDCGCYTRPNVTIKPERILLFSDELFDQVIAEAIEYFEQKKQEQIQAEEDEAIHQLAEQERTERLEPEKKIIRNYLVAIGKIKRPISIQEPETVGFLDQLTRSIDQVMAQQLELLEQL